MDLTLRGQGRTRSIVRSNALWRCINQRLTERGLLAGHDEDGTSQPDQYDPVVELAVMGLDRRNEPAVRYQCHKAVAGFLYPTLTAVQVTNDDEAGKRSHDLNHRLLDILEKTVAAAPTPKVIDGAKITEATPGEHGGHD